MTTPEDEMRALFLMPPKVVDLVWKRDEDDCYVAEITKAWLVLWSGDDRMDQLMHMGFSTGTVIVEDKALHQVRWNPHVGIKYAMLAEDLDLLETQHASDIAYAKAQQRGLEAHAIERAKAAAEAANKVDPAVERQAAQARQRNLVADFGRLLSAADLSNVQHWIRTGNTYNAEMRSVDRMLVRVEAKIANFFDKRADRPVVDWSEKRVIAAARYLTGLDVDGAREQNGQGWSGSDTVLGHWCVDAFKGAQYELAVRVARVLVAGYADTQLREHAA